MMSRGLRRSMSLSTPSPNRPPVHVRSASLPCPSHPLIPRLRDEITGLKTWAASLAAESSSRNSAWLCDGLSRLRAAQDSLDDVLQTPQARDAFRRRSHLVESILEEFLVLVDAYGIFRGALLALKEENTAAQVAARKGDDDDAMIAAAYAKAFKKVSKEIGQLAAAVRRSACCGRQSLAAPDSDEVVGVAKEVVEAMVSASVVVFTGVVGASSTTENLKGWARWKFGKKPGAEGGREELRGVVGVEGNLWGLKRKEGLKRMRDVEECLDSIESECEKVFRSLINARVSLLNILSN